MEKPNKSIISTLNENFSFFLRKSLFSILSFGPMPNHIAFIMDGNRRYAKRQTVQENNGHRLGFKSLLSALQYCYEMEVKYVTVYAFSIDNFNRDPKEVQSLMDLMREKIEELLDTESLVSKYGVKINFWGDLELLNEPVKLSAIKAMDSTVNNTGPVLSVCVAYNSTSEILHAVKSAFRERREKVVGIGDLEKHLYTNGCPDPDIVIRTSGETRLSNFLLWQTGFSHLQNPDPLWPEFSFRHIVWCVLEYQRVYNYLKERRDDYKEKK